MSELNGDAIVGGQPVLSLQGIERSFRQGRQILEILKDVSLTVRAGEIVAKLLANAQQLLDIVAYGLQSSHKLLIVVRRDVRFTLGHDHVHEVNLQKEGKNKQTK